jgi:hypothetical protein
LWEKAAEGRRTPKPVGLSPDQPLARSVLDCASPLALFVGRRKAKHAGFYPGVLADKINFSAQRFLATSFQLITFQIAFR